MTIGGGPSWSSYTPFVYDDGSEPYRVKPAEGRFEVQDESRQVTAVCRDEHSAKDYAVLLNEAYRRGSKAGYRDARKPGGMAARTTPQRGICRLPVSATFCWISGSIELGCCRIEEIESVWPSK